MTRTQVMQFGYNIHQWVPGESPPEVRKNPWVILHCRTQRFVGGRYANRVNAVAALREELMSPDSSWPHTFGAT